MRIGIEITKLLQVLLIVGLRVKKKSNFQSQILKNNNNNNNNNNKKEEERTKTLKSEKVKK